MAIHLKLRSNLRYNVYKEQSEKDSKHNEDTRNEMGLSIQ